MPVCIWKTAALLSVYRVALISLSLWYGAVCSIRVVSSPMSHGDFTLQRITLSTATAINSACVVRNLYLDSFTSYMQNELYGGTSTPATLESVALNERKESVALKASTPGCPRASSSSFVIVVVNVSRQTLLPCGIFGVVEAPYRGLVCPIDEMLLHPAHERFAGSRGDLQLCLPASMTRGRRSWGRPSQYRTHLSSNPYSENLSAYDS